MPWVSDDAIIKFILVTEVYLGMLRWIEASYAIFCLNDFAFKANIEYIKYTLGTVLHLAGVVSPGWIITKGTNGTSYTGLFFVMDCPMETGVCTARSWFDVYDVAAEGPEDVYPRQYVTVGVSCIAVIMNIAAAVTCYQASKGNRRTSSLNTLSTAMVMAISSFLTLTIVTDYAATLSYHSSKSIESSETFPYSLGATCLGTFFHIVIFLSYTSAIRRALRKVPVWDEEEVRPVLPPSYDTMSYGISNPIYQTSRPKEIYVPRNQQPEPVRIQHHNNRGLPAEGNGLSAQAPSEEMNNANCQNRN